MTNKLTDVSEVVRTIPDGSHIALGGFTIARNVIAVVHELIRQQKKGLTLSQGIMGMETDLLVGAGLVSRLIAGAGALDRFGLLHCVNRARNTGQVVSLDQSSLSVAFGYLAGALGISFLPIKSLLASELFQRLEAGPAAGDFQRMKCPFTEEPYLLLKAITPDISLLHVQVADRDGNCQIAGPRWENEVQAKAARRIIVMTEELVETDYIRRSPGLTVIPGHRVEAVIHQPFGAYPTAVFGCYDYDADHLKLYADHAKHPERMRQYLDNYVLSTRDHWEYLEKAGGLKRLNQLKADPILGY